MTLGRFIRFAFPWTWVWFALAIWPWGATAAETGAVVFMYHRFGESKYPSTNITLEQFEAHIQELQSGPYRVLPLPEIIKALRQGSPLPDRTVGLSIDDAFLSVYTEAWPRLKKSGLPFTVFIATGVVDRKVRGYMNWDQIREMASAGVTIGSHTVSHLHMPDATQSKIQEEIEHSNSRFEKELGQEPEIFAFPYGESSLAVQEGVKENGFLAAFGQHSGVIGGRGNFFDLPRFAMNENYANLARFKLVVNALPLPITDITPADPLISSDNPPAMGFTVAPGIKGMDRLACFSTHEGRARLERLGERRIEIRVEQAFPKGRTRVNCTLPAGQGRWYWFGRQFYRPG
ncbi:MAG: polysaccharide deacetylase family protein [Rhodospirillales bacterium]